MNAKLRWARKVPDSEHNFDLILTNPQDLDNDRINNLLEGILQESHRRQTLKSTARKEFQRWLSSPATPLKSTAYILLSNWFMTRSGDRNSMVAGGCEVLWDELFPCRPVNRLSSPEAGRNHLMIPSEFASFWQRVSKAQGEDFAKGGRLPSDPNVKPPSEPNQVREGVERSRTDDLPDDPTSDWLRAMFDNNGLHFEVEGSPRALADFLKVYSRSPALPKESK